MGSFRPSGKLRQLHTLEIALVAIAAANLIFLPWAYGGMVMWAQALSLGGSLLAFVVAVWPRNYTELHTGGERFRLYPAPKLLRFPIFYLGLLYFAFVGVQLANPAWVYVERSGGWWLESQNHLAWLPHGIAGTPFQRMDAWRMLMLHGSAWLMVCALWIGITRRKSAQALLMAIALNGTLLALVLLLQRLTHAKEFLWFWPAPSDYFVATFVYKNHGGAFWVMILMLCLGFAWWHADRAEQRLSKSNPSLAWLFLSLVTLVGLFLSYARASSGLGAAAAVAVAISYLIHLSFAGRGGTPAPVAGLSALVIGGFLVTCLSLIDTDKIWKKFEQLTKEDQRTSIVFRQLATKATWDMAQDSLAWGHGVGGYRYLFPAYQQKYPEIFMEKAWVNRKLITRRVYWEHAHNDYVEWVAEAGLFGVGLLLAGGVTVLAAARRFGTFSRPSLIVILAGPCLVMVAAAVDFPAHCPAILLTAAAILPLGLRWSEIEARRKR